MPTPDGFRSRSCRFISKNSFSTRIAASCGGRALSSPSSRRFSISSIYLVRNRERVVTKDDLLDAVWNGRVVSESTLTSRINAARRALGDSGDEQRLIRTVARKGLRFVGAVEWRRRTVR